MMQAKRWRVLAGLCATTVMAVTLLSGCSREGDDWRAAQAADTVAAYDQFLREHPGSDHATDASTRVTQIAEDEDWQRATTDDSQKAYQEFLVRHPEGKWSQEARVRVETFTVAETPAAALDSPATAMADLTRAGTAAPPAPTPAPVAVPAVPRPALSPTARQAIPAGPAAKPGKPAPPANARRASAAGVQLGSFSTLDAAEGQWRKLDGRYPQLAGLTHRVVKGRAPSGTVYRLQVPTETEPLAHELCTGLKKKGQACLVYH